MMNVPCVVLKVQRKFKYSSLAQLVERAAVNRVVAGSSPAGGANKTRRTMDSAGFILFRTKNFVEKEKTFVYYNNIFFTGRCNLFAEWNESIIEV